MTDRQVIAEGQYLLYNWLVKVLRLLCLLLKGSEADPDTVFFPQRLIPILRRHEAGRESPEPSLIRCLGSMSQESPGAT